MIYKSEIQRCAGATLTELITVLVLLGIVAALALPRFFQRNEFDSRGYFEQSLSAVKYAQKLAIASGCDVRVEFDGAGYNLQRWVNGSSCAADGSGSGLTAIPLPGGGGDFSATAPTGVSVDTELLYFDIIGRPRDANAGVNFGDLLATQTDISIGSRIIRVEDETGYSHCASGCL